MSKCISLIGQKFGRLTVIGQTENYISRSGKQHTAWECICSCTNRTKCIVIGNNLTKGNTRSCGCIKKEAASRLNKSHGKSETRLYGIWCGMKKRCYNKKEPCYGRYGGKGITVCAEWLDKENGFINFYNWSMAHGYDDNLSIDRIANDSGYSPENCRWVTTKIQNNNSSNCHFVNYKGCRKTISQLSEEYNVPYYILYQRICKLNWSIDDSIRYPVKRGNNQNTRKKPF